MAYEIVDMLLTNRLRPRVALSPQGMVLHETATPNATALNEQKYFANGAGGRSVSTHAFIDYQTIIRTIPFNERAWHAGGTANSRFIGVEMCHFDEEDKFNEVYNRAVWLFAYTFVNVLNIKTVTKDNLMSHEEVSKKWHETNHVDPVSYLAQFGKTMDIFRADVQDYINKMIQPLAPVESVKSPSNPYDVKFLQRSIGVTVDGIAGNQTLGACPTIKKGSKGNAVKFVQSELGVGIDGDFGNITYGAVTAFQRRHGLVADGIVGKKTWRKLLGIA